MPSFQHLAGQFFLESAVILYDDLARRAECDGADEALVRRRVSAAKRLIELIGQHGTRNWERQLAQLRGDISA